MEMDSLVARRTGMKRMGARTVAWMSSAAVALTAVSWSGPTFAQSSDPFAPPGQSGTDSSGSSGSSSGQSQGSGSGGQGSGGFSGSASAQATSFSPTVITGSSMQGAMAGQLSNATPVTNPTDGSTPGPLYARPGAQPGQFELFQRPPPDLNEFEKFVTESVGQPLPRFGSSLILTRSRGFAVAATTTVPADYALNPGDELIVGITGSVEADLHLVIDSDGRIFIPHIGEINVAGVRYGDLAAALSRRVDEQYKQAKVSVVVSHLHGLTVYVTGYAVSPGSYAVSSLATMIDAVLAAGGPAAGGSFRTVELRRNGQLITTLDLYDLLLNGDKSHDATLQNGDVLNIAPVGPELAIVGSVNAQAIYEAKPGETLGDVLRFAGGFDSLADTSRVVLSSLEDLDKTGSRQLDIATAKATPAERGDIVRILSLARVVRPQERQAILATVEGEVDHPGRYYLKPGSTLNDLLAQAGGLTSGAFVFGTQFDRETLKQQQQVSFDKAIANLQMTAAALPLQSTVFSGGPAAAAARSQGALAIIERMKTQKPDGRLVLEMSPDATRIPDQILLENNDHIFIPPRPKTVGVFGAVYQTGSFLYKPGTRVQDYVKLAGGAQRIADPGDIFLIHANGAVESNRVVHNLGDKTALPGDVVFMPVNTKAPLLDKFMIFAGIIDQYAIGILALTALGL
jgi:protein involved in polysaccharide export with SLBB domain